MILTGSTNPALVRSLLPEQVTLTDHVILDDFDHQSLSQLAQYKRIVAAVSKQDLPLLRTSLLQDDLFMVDLDDPFGAIGCVIMASGEGKRFGGNKLMTAFKGMPMIQWALNATESIFAQRVVVTRHQDIQCLCEDLAIPSVLHDLPYRSDTVRLGLEALDMDLIGCVFCPGDQPLLTWETVASLALCAKNNCSSIWRTECEGSPGSPVYFPQKYFPDLRHLPEGKGGNAVVRKNIENVSYLSVSNPMELMDIDTRETFDKLSADYTCCCSRL